MDSTIIKVRCRTNLDKFKLEKWPEEFVCRPIVGDWVQSESGSSLMIHSVTHSQQKVYDMEFHPGHQQYEPILIIELHKADHSCL